MDLKTRLENDMREAMRTSDDIRKRTLRMVIASIKNQEIDRGIKLDDSAISSILQKEIKSRREAIAEAEKARRADLVQSSSDEIGVLEAYLPKAISEEEVRAIVAQVIEELKATSLADMGKIIKATLAKAQGRAPGDLVSKVVREQLQN